MESQMVLGWRIDSQMARELGDLGCFITISRETTYVRVPEGKQKAARRVVEEYMTSAGVREGVRHLQWESS